MKSFTFTSALLSLVTATACLPSVPPPTTPDKCGCGKALPTVIQAGESQEFKLESKSGVSPRRYRIHIPKSYNKDKRVPVILSFHGRGGNAKKQEALSQFSDPKFGFEGISVYPEGVPVRCTQLISF
jgi:poly(3-hydroxybutyrate) depolymerase